MKQPSERDKSSSKVPVQSHIGVLTGVVPEAFPVLAVFLLVSLLMILPLQPVPATVLRASVLTLSALLFPSPHLLNRACLLLPLEPCLSFVFLLTPIP